MKKYGRKSSSDEDDFTEASGTDARDLRICTAFLKDVAPEKIATDEGISLTQTYRIIDRYGLRKLKKKSLFSKIRKIARDIEIEKDKVAEEKERTKDVVEHRGKLGRWTLRTVIHPPGYSLPNDPRCWGVMPPPIPLDDIKIVEIERTDSYTKIVRAYFTTVRR